MRCVITLSGRHRFRETTRTYNIDRPALDTLVRGLRRRLSLALFSHGDRPVDAARDKHAIISRTHIILCRVTRLGRVAHSRGRLDDKEVHVKIVPAMTPCVLPQLFGRVRRVFPRVRLHTFRLHATIVVRRLHGTRLSVTVLIAPLRRPSFLRVPLCCRGFTTCMSPDRRLCRGRRVITRRVPARRL